MKTLRIPTTSDEVTPELLRDLILNLRKLCNISGTGCTVNELPNGISIDIAKPLEHRRGRLLEDLYGCDKAQATEITVDAKGETIDLQEFTVTDPLDKTSEHWSALEDADGDVYIPSGTCFDSHFRSDSQQWELESIGLCCHEGSGEGSGPEGSGPDCCTSYCVTGVSGTFPFDSQGLQGIDPRGEYSQVSEGTWQLSNTHVYTLKWDSHFNEWRISLPGFSGYWFVGSMVSDQQCPPESTYSGAGSDTTIEVTCCGEGSGGGSGEEGSVPEGSGCLYPITGMALAFPIITNPAYVLGQTSDGCWGWVAVAPCAGSG